MHKTIILALALSACNCGDTRPAAAPSTTGDGKAFTDYFGGTDETALYDELTGRRMRSTTPASAHVGH